ncbi:MAG: hypothetical protein ACOY5B_02660 [Spirochaetota bacterium]
MKMNWWEPLCLCFGCLVGLSCAPRVAMPQVPESAEFKSYWLSGTAEVTSYDLTQARYGNLNHGQMVLIMVSEPFRTDKQVKSELHPGLNDTTIMKAQTVRKFITGIYDYTMTTTSFKPLGIDDKALKINATSTEWCGQTFQQFNLKSGAYDVQSRSYFESEADENFTIGDAISEDEIWQRVRMAPDLLPRGPIKLIPSLVSSRLRHRKPAIETVTAELTEYSGKAAKAKDLRTYRLTYAAGSKEERTVEFVFERKFPHRIVEFNEEYLDGFSNPRRLRTTAVYKRQLKLDYWRTHDPEHVGLRKELGL